MGTLVFYIHDMNRPVWSGIHVALPFLISQPSPLPQVMLLHLSECIHKKKETEEEKGKKKGWRVGESIEVRTRIWQISIESISN